MMGGPDPGPGQAATNSAELEGPDLVGWLNCECFFSLVLVGLLAALPFNLHCNEVFQTRDTYLARADEYFTEQAFDKAATLYERALSAEETPEGHAALAETFLRLDRVGDATIHLARAEELLTPEDVAKVPSIIKIGKLYRDLGRADLAATTYGRVLRLKDGVNCKDVADAHVQVALSLLESKRYEEAVEHLEAATAQGDALPTTLAQAHYLLAGIYRDMGLVDKAVGRLRKAVKNAPRDLNALSSLGLAYHESGNFKQALVWYKKVHQLGTPAAVDMTHHIIAALTPKNETSAKDSPPITRASPLFLSLFFDLQATRRLFLSRRWSSPLGSDPLAADAWWRHGGGDDALPEVTPAQDIFGLVFGNISATMRGMVETALGLPVGSTIRWLDVLDLGCGMGQAGRQFRSLSNRLVGVDISKASVDVAVRTGVYDEVWHADIEANLTSLLPGSTDLVILSDVVPYFGSLEVLLTRILTVLRPGGLVVMNTDQPQTPDDCSGLAGGSQRQQSTVLQGYSLRPTGRWVHCPAYVEAVLQRVGLQVRRTSTLAAPTHYKRGADGQIQKTDRALQQQSRVYLMRSPEGDTPLL